MAMSPQAITAARAMTVRFGIALREEDKLDQQSQDERAEGEDGELEHCDLRLQISDILSGRLLLSDRDGPGRRPGFLVGRASFKQGIVDLADDDASLPL